MPEALNALFEAVYDLANRNRDSSAHARDDAGPDRIRDKQNDKRGWSLAESRG